MIAALACWYWEFDAISMIFLKEKVTLLGMIITGGVVAGGSKGAIKLFRDVMGFKSTAQLEKEEGDKAKNLQLASRQAPEQGGDQ